MKIQLVEYDGCFSVEMEAETKEDVSQLARLGIDATKEIKSFGVGFPKDSAANGIIVIGKRRKWSSTIHK